MTDDVTVVVTTFAARPKWMLERAVESAKPQATVIIADDGDSPIDHCYASWWEGIYRARTPFVCVLHDDDWYEPTFVHELRSLIVNDRVAYSFCNGVVHLEDGTTDSNLVIGHGEPHLGSTRSMVEQLLKLAHTLSPSCCMFRREDALRDLFPGGVPGMPRRRVLCGPDQLLSTLPLLRYEAVGIDPRPLVHMQAHPGSVTTRAMAEDDLHRDLLLNYMDAKYYFTKLMRVECPECKALVALDNYCSSCGGALLLGEPNAVHPG